VGCYGLDVVCLPRFTGWELGPHGGDVKRW
jgi:hypothetical protein